MQKLSKKSRLPQSSQANYPGNVGDFQLRHDRKKDCTSSVITQKKLILNRGNSNHLETRTTV